MSPDQKNSFTERFVRSQRQVYGYIVTLLADRDDAEDVFQQTCLVLWEKWEQYDPTREFLPWACGVALNVARNFKRKGRRERIGLSDELMAEVARVRLDSEQVLEDRRRALADCLGKLPTRQHKLIERCYLGSETIRTIAEQLGLRPDALYKRLQRIRRVLFECLDQALGGEEA